MSLFGELKRRNVFRAGIAYLIVSWVLAQVADLVLDNISAPAWVMQVILLALALGLVLVIFFSWAFEVTPEGIKREADVDRSNSITNQTGRKLDRSITFLLIVAVAYFFWESRYSDPSQSESLNSEQTETTASAAVAPATESDVSESEVDKHSIAVLPFDNRSNLEEDEFFVEGVHDDLLTKLSKIGGLKVISRTSMTRYRDTQIPIPEIAAELGVATIMEGSVQRAGNKVRINVQLIDAQTDEHLWAEIFDRELTTENLFAIQSEISQNIAEALKTELSVEEQQRVSDRPTDNLAAYSAFQRGRQLIARRTAEAIDQALLEFQRAVELDPDFALAWVGIADSASLALGYSDMDRPEATRLSSEAIENALAINNQLGEAHLARAVMLEYSGGQDEEIEREYQLAIKLSPGYAQAWQWYASYVNDFQSRLPEALKIAERAAELDPLSSTIQNQVITIFGQLGRYDEAQQKLKNLIEQDPGFAQSYERMSRLKDDQAQFDQSVYWLRKAQSLDPGNIGYVMNELFPQLGMDNTAGLEELLARMAIMDPNSSTLSFMEIWVNIHKGNYAAALESARNFHQQTGSRPPAIRPQFVVQTLLEDYSSARAAAESALPEYFDRSKWHKLLKDEPEMCCQMSWTLTHSNDEEMGLELARQTVAYVLNEMPRFIDNKSRNTLGTCYMVLDRPDDALTSIENPIKLGKITSWWIDSKHPAYQLLKHEPRFQAAEARAQDIMRTQRENLIRLEAEGSP